MTRSILDTLDIDTVVANSFRDYHVKGFDYICLKRRPRLTEKLYFFDGDVAKLPEVVNPHDHRYDFETYVVAGRSQNSWYEAHERGEVYEKWSYETPLNGGNGFTHAGTDRLLETQRCTYRASNFRANAGYYMGHEEIHTIRLVENETVLYLRQYEDEVEVGTPTLTYSKTETMPDLSGMYRRFTADQVVARLKNFEARSGALFNHIRENNI